MLHFQIVTINRSTIDRVAQSLLPVSGLTLSVQTSSPPSLSSTPRINLTYNCCSTEEGEVVWGPHNQNSVPPIEQNGGFLLRTATAPGMAQHCNVWTYFLMRFNFNFFYYNHERAGEMTNEAMESSWRRQTKRRSCRGSKDPFWRTTSICSPYTLDVLSCTFVSFCLIVCLSVCLSVCLHLSLSVKMAREHLRSIVS